MTVAGYDPGGAPPFGVGNSLITMLGSPGQFRYRISNGIDRFPFTQSQ
jgi:hypothetical protein